MPTKEKKLKVINIFGAPNAGKSTVASGLFYLMKINGYNVELINESAKEMVWNEQYNQLEEQLLVFAKQYEKLFPLSEKVEYVIKNWLWKSSTDMKTSISF